MTCNLFQRSEDIQFYVDPTKIEGFTEQTSVQMVLCPDGLDLNREASASKIVVLDAVRDDGNLVFTASREVTAKMATGDYNIELVYDIDGQRTICKSVRAFTLEDSATNHINTSDNED